MPYSVLDTSLYRNRSLLNSVFKFKTSSKLYDFATSKGRVKKILFTLAEVIFLPHHDASSSNTEMSTFFSGDHATQQTLNPTELRTDQISIKGLAILTLEAGEK